MKLLVSLLFVAGICFVNAGLTLEQIEKVKKLQDDCINETGVNPDVIQQAKQGKFTEDEKLKQYLFCMSKKLGFQNDAGDLQPDVIKAKVGAALGDVALVEQLIGVCAQPKANGAETAYQTVKCYHEKTPQRVIIV